MKKALVSVWVLAALLGSSGIVWADTPTFPTSFTTSYADATHNKQVKVQGPQLRLAIDLLDGTSQENYLVDVEQGTILKATGPSYTNGGAGWNGVFNQIKHDLEDIRDGLEDSGDSAGADNVQGAIDYMDGWSL